MEVRNLTAAVYLNFSGPDARSRLETYREQAFQYCEKKGYDLLVLIEYVGPEIVCRSGTMIVSTSSILAN